MLNSLIYVLIWLCAIREDSSVDQDIIDEGEASAAPKDPTKELDKFGRETPTDSPAISSKADTPIPETSSHDGTETVLDDEKTWPSVVDLNTRLRRVISSYQRTVNKTVKDDMKNVQKIVPKTNVDVEMTNTAGTTTDQQPPLNMQGWDLQQLAMYLLVSMIEI